MAPIGVQGIVHDDAEIGVARACSELGVPYILSTASTTSIEDLEKSNPTNDSPPWFQLYWPLDDDITASLLRRAQQSGFTALVVTLDTFTLSWRPRDLDSGYLPMAVGVGNAVGFSDPVVRRKFAELNDGDSVDDNLIQASRYWLSETFSGQSHAWEDLRLLRKQWKGPILLKGIQSVEDARLAVQHGMDGIIVSNHGGRQVDGAIGSLEVLPEIVDAVGQQTTVLFDSGIRTGVDILKALALGAKAVLVGRPVIYGLGIAGQEGARQVLAGLLADLDTSMGLAGLQNLGDVNRGILRTVKYGGDVRSSL
jgi:lactate 2-monooxygenase